MIRSSRPVLRFAAVGVVVLALGLSGCGRKGPLEPPGASVADPADPVEYDAQGKPLAPPGQKKRLPIDWLLD